MIKKLEVLLNNAHVLASESEKRQAAIALCRIVLQHICVALAEWLVWSRSDVADIVGASVPLPLEELRSPSDGTLVSTLGELLVAAENQGWNGVSRPYWQNVEESRPCTRLCRESSPNIERLLQEFVTLRNNGVEGHGIPGNFDSDAELDLVKLLIQRLEPVFPVATAGTDDLELVHAPGGRFRVKTLRTFSADLMCYRKLQRTGTGRCRVSAQIQRSLFAREEITYEIEDVLNPSQTWHAPKYVPITTNDREWHPFALIPERLTDHFTGRQNEIQDLVQWADDTESRACMIFGDGGVGKTTLAIEWLHQYLDGKTAVSWRPQLITYYTAKQTRWGLNGLEVIRARDVGAADAVLSVARAFHEEPLTREWYSKDPNTLVQRLAGFLADLRIDRNSHLLILDNTETMAQNEDDVRALVGQIQELSRRVGRVLLTSRRREAIEARQIEIKPLSDDQAVDLLRRRGQALGRQPITQAGNSTLRKYAHKLGNKPLVLEVFIQALGEPGISLERAFDRVLRMQRQDLGEFLYSDAWKRMTHEMKHLLLLMTRVIDIHDEMLLRLCCLQVNITVIEASDALEESRGIANLSRVNGGLQIVFSPEFLKFCDSRTIQVDGVSVPTAGSVEAVKRRYNEFLRSSTTQVFDRIGRAYRHVLARAAWIAFNEGRLDDCEIFYEEAVVADGDNGWLFDRYAYFLFAQKRLPEALDKAKVSTSLIPDDAEAWFTRGMIEGRMGFRDEAALSLQRAGRLGKAAHLCLIQLAYAHLNVSPPDLVEARICLKESESRVPSSDRYYYKHLAEIERVRRRYSLG